MKSLGDRSGLILLELLAIIVCFVVLVMVVLAPAFRRQKHATGAPTCQNNLKQLGVVFKMYSGEAKGERFPPVYVYPNGEEFSFALAPNIKAVYPEYSTDVKILFCPSDRNDRPEDVLNESGETTIHISESDGGSAGMGDACYTYWGWVFDKAGDEAPSGALGEALAKALNAEPMARGPMQIVDALNNAGIEFNSAEDIQRVDTDLITTRADLGNGDSGDKMVYRLREGIERFTITDINNPAASARAQSILWIMHDGIPADPSGFNHTPVGCNVLFLDGHVEFIRYPGEAPVNKNMAALIGGMY